MMRWNTTKGLLFLTTVTLCNLASHSTYGSDLNWRSGKQLNEALEESHLQQKPILLHFGADWCGPCQKLKHQVFREVAFVSAATDFVLLEIDVDRYPKLAEQFDVDAVPYDVYLSSDGTPVAAGTSPRTLREYLTTLLKVRELAEHANALTPVETTDVQMGIRQPLAR